MVDQEKRTHSLLFPEVITLLAIVSLLNFISSLDEVELLLEGLLLSSLVNLIFFLNYQQHLDIITL